MEVEVRERKSTHLTPSRKRGRGGLCETPDKRTGITGSCLATNSRRIASRSLCCQGFIPLLPTQITAALICASSRSSTDCQGCTGPTSLSSNQGYIPLLSNCLANCLTAVLSSSE